MHETAASIAEVEAALPASIRHVLILGGTREAAELAARLVEAGHDVTTSLAGRTREPSPVAGKLRIGGFGGMEGLAAHLADHAVDLLIDATHPFATRISTNAVAAAMQTGTRLIRLERPRWQKVVGDIWLEVAALEDAASAIPAGARVLLALGSQHISAFSERDDVFFLIRMVDLPLTPPPLARHCILAAKPGNAAEEEALLRTHAITHVVCRNSGGSGAYAKIVAARALALPVIMIR